MVTHRIHMLLDRSGSMDSYRNQTIEAVNAYLATLRADALAADTSFSLTTFDSQSFDAVRRDERGSTVRDMVPAEFEPRAATPLYDAVGHVLDIESRVRVAGRRAVVIVTDGAENGSRRLGVDAVRKLVAGRERDGWIFIFLGANQNAPAEAAKLGVAPQRAIAYRAGSGTAAAATFAAAAAVSFGYFMLGPGAAAAAAPAFSEADRQAAFDGAPDWEAEMMQDMASAPREPAAGPEPATISESSESLQAADHAADQTAADDVAVTGEASQAGDGAAESVDGGDDDGSILDTITDAIGSLFSVIGGSISGGDSGDGGDSGGGDGGGGGD